MQVHGEGGVGVGAGIDGAIIVFVLGDRNPLSSGELLFQVMGDGLLLFQVRAAVRSHAHASYRVLHAAAKAAMRASCSQCAVTVAA
jgi:hypothetical protein